MKYRSLYSFFIFLSLNIGSYAQESQLTSVAKFGTLDNLLKQPIKPKDTQSVRFSEASILPSAITGAFLISEIKNAVNGIIDHLANVAPAVAAQIAGDLNQISSELARQISDLSKPINELNRNIQELGQRAMVAIDQTKYFISATLRCLKYDLEFLTAGLQSSIHQIVAEALPWTKKTPVLTRMYQRGSNTPYGIRINTSSTIILEGYNFSANEKKGGVQIKIFKSGDNLKVLKSKIESYDRNRVIVFVEAPVETGNYICEVTFNRAGFLGIGKKNYKISNLLVVIPKQEFTIKYEIKPTCILKPTIDFLAGEISGTNDACDGDRLFGGNFVMPGPWKYTGFNFIETSNNGCELHEKKYLGGNMVQVIYRCPERGGIFCTGARKWIKGQVHIFGEMESIEDGAIIVGEYPNKLSYNQTVDVISLTGKPCEVNNWSVSVKLIYPDGSEHDIPSQTGSGNLSGSNSEGAAFFWNSSLMRLSITTPTYDCGL